MRGLRIIMGSFALLSTASASAQSFNQEWQRYRFAQFQCTERHRVRTEASCDARCRQAATERQTRCLATAEQRYERALRRVLRSRR